jgi:hemolysin D
MSRSLIVDLADCSEFRQTLAARPPRIVHGAALLLMSLIVAAVAWSALVKANLVVRATGRVRPVDVPTRIFTSTGSDLEGRVVEAPFEEGDIVHQGVVLVRLDTARINNQIAKLERTMEATEEELAKLTGLRTLLSQQLHSAKEKSQAELAQAQAALSLATRRRISEIGKSQADVQAAADHLRRIMQLRDSKAITEEELVKAQTDYRKAREQLVQADFPVDQSPVMIARPALDLVNRDFAVRSAELETRVAAKKGEVEAARKELANLNIQRDEAVLRAPIDGVIVAGHVNPGDVLQPGKPVFEIARQQGYLFEATIPNQDVGNLRVGMPVRIKFDAYDFQKYGVLEGTVVYLSPDSKLAEKAEDTETARTVRTPGAFIVRIDLKGDQVGRGELRGHIKLGLGGTAEIVTGHESVLAILVKRIRQTISLG